MALSSACSTLPSQRLRPQVLPSSTPLNRKREISQTLCADIQSPSGQSQFPGLRQRRSLVRSLQRKLQHPCARCTSQSVAVPGSLRKGGWSTVVPALAAAVVLSWSLPAEAMTAPLLLQGTAAVQIIDGLAEAAGDLSAPAVAATPEERVAALKELLAQRKREKEAAEAAAAQAKAEAAAAAAALVQVKEPPQSSRAAPVKVSSPAAPAVTGTPPPTKAPPRSHGYMPLFLSQFLLFAAYGGVITAIVKVPASVWEAAQKQAEEAAVKAVPLLDSALEQSKPFIAKAWVAGEAAAVEARPYVEKAVEAAKPALARGWAAALAVLQSGREKVAESVAQAQAEAAAKKSSSPP